jgi:hypothetical protein
MLELYPSTINLGDCTYVPMDGGSVVLQFVCHIDYNARDIALVTILRLNLSRWSNLRISPACLDPGSRILIVEQLGGWKVHPVSIKGAILQLKFIIAGDSYGHFLLVIGKDIKLLPIRRPFQPALPVRRGRARFPSNHLGIFAFEFVCNASRRIEFWSFGGFHGWSNV